MYLNKIIETSKRGEENPNLLIILDKSKLDNNHQYAVSLIDKKIVHVFNNAHFKRMDKKFDRECFEELQTYIDVHTEEWDLNG